MRRIRIFIALYFVLGLLSPFGRASSFLSVLSAWADVRISNMNNIGLGSWDGSGDVTDEDGVCVFNDGGPNYLITASGSGGGGSFELSNGSESIDYEVRFKGTSISANNSHSFSGADEIDDSCGGGTNATVRITVPESELLDAHKGSYSGTLNLQVDPN